jgi:threonyl-tRNA synthetase
MITITLPDGNTKKYDHTIDGFQIASDISSNLKKEAMAMEIDGTLVDLSTQIASDAKVKIITNKDPEGLEILRHDTAHCLAQAIKNLYPKTQITIGPTIKDGFYYDVLPEKPFTPDDLKSLEKEIKKIAAQNHKISREVWNREEAIKFFHSIGEHFKAEIIEEIPQGEKISLYRQGEFIDLCRGPHAPSTKFVQHFKLMKLAGAYWRGDHNNVMLQRIYGTAWATKEDLDQYLFRLEEAEKRDHRKLGKQLDLFHIQDESPGMIFWHHKGYTLYYTLKEYIKKKLTQNDYIEVKTPTILDISLWQKSGHWEKFGEHMFTTHEKDNRHMAIKPMNCPCHIEIFKKGITSYKDLPIRMAEFGCCHRNEPSGALHGLMRVREFTQDDAHIFCTEAQIEQETKNFIALLREVYKDLGFTEISIKFSDRPEIRAGTNETWDKAEKH